MTAFIVLAFALAGFSANIADGDSCADALHELRTKHRLGIESSLAVEGEVLYRLTNKTRFGGTKTAQLVCGPEGGADEGPQP